MHVLEKLFIDKEYFMKIEFLIIQEKCFPYHLLLVYLLLNTKILSMW